MGKASDYIQNLRKFDKFCQVIDHLPIMLVDMNLLMGSFHSDTKS